MAGPAPAFARVIAGGLPLDRMRIFRGSLKRQILLPAGISVVYAVLAVAHLLGNIPASDLAAGWLFTVIYPAYFCIKLGFFALNRIGTYAVLEICSDVLFFVLLGVFAVLAPTYLLFTFGIAYSLFVLVSLAIVHRGTPAPAIVPPIDRALYSFSAAALAATYASVAVAPMLTLLTADLASRPAAAKLGAAIALTAPLLLVPQAIGMLTFADAARDPELARTELPMMVRRTTLVSTFLIAGTVLAAGVVVPRVLGPSYGSSTTLFILISGSFIARVVATPIANAIAGFGQPGINAAISAVAFVVAIVIGAVGIPIYGVGAAAAALTVNNVLLGLPFLYLGRTRYATPIGLPLVCFGLVTAAVAGGLEIDTVPVAGTALLGLAAVAGVAWLAGGTGHLTRRLQAAGHGGRAGLRATTGRHDDRSDTDGSPPQQSPP
jgi:O-antigen/teichoic acid export membrane protein